MPLWIIIVLIFALYLRTLEYKYIIDDSVQRDGYLKEDPNDIKQFEITKKRPSKIYRLFMISMHAVNVSIIYMLWGWCPALLFAVHPMGIWGTVWVTGNYYATTAYFILISYFMIHTLGSIGILASIPIYTAALNSTIGAVMFPFFLLFTKQWLAAIAMTVPLYFFLTGARFQNGLRMRTKLIVDPPSVLHLPIIFGKRFDWRRINLMIKVVARYIYQSMYPWRISMFYPFGKGLNSPIIYKEMHSFNLEFWCALLLCTSLFALGMIVSPVAVMLFFVFIALHSHWNLYGQFFADRYLYLPLIGVCVIAGNVLTAHPILLTIITTALMLKTIMHTPKFRDILAFLENDYMTFPNFVMANNNYAGTLLKCSTCHISEELLALSILKRAEALEPRYWESLVNLAKYYDLKGLPEPSLEYTNRAIEVLEGETFAGHRYYTEELNKLHEQRKALEDVIRFAKDQKLELQPA